MGSQRSSRRRPPESARSRRRTKNVPGALRLFTVERLAVKSGTIVSSTLALAVAAFALLSASGCTREIGDECQTSVDCDPSGRRACDLSQPGGYCTIVGCSETSCPESSACIRYFPEAYLTVTLQPGVRGLPRASFRRPSEAPATSTVAMCPTECMPREIENNVLRRRALSRLGGLRAAGARDARLRQDLRRRRRLPRRLSVPRLERGRQHAADHRPERPYALLRPDRELAPRRGRGQFPTGANATTL